MKAYRNEGKQGNAYTAIRDRILSGVYGPGYRLVLNSLAQELDCSPIPVREAIRRLEAEGLVEFHRNSGARVAPADAKATVEILTVLAVLDGYATAQAAPKLTAADLARLRDLNDRMRAAQEEGDVVGSSQFNRQFHYTIFEQCGNAFLVECITQTWDRLDVARRSIFLHDFRRVRDSLREHDELIDLIAAKAPPAVIQALAQQHKLRTMETFQVPDA